MRHLRHSLVYRVETEGAESVIERSETSDEIFNQFQKHSWNRVGGQAEPYERSETSDEIFNQFQTTAETPGAEPYEKLVLTRHNFSSLTTSNLQTLCTLLVCCLLFCVAISTQEAGEQFTIAQIHYGGGGDWYGDATAIRNWLQILRTRTDIETAEDRVILKLTEHTLYQYPMLYLVGHGNIRLTESEIEALRHYLMHGGFLFANDDYGLDESFRREMRRIFPEQQLQPIPNAHPIYHCFYDLPGLPKIHEHDSEPAQGFGLFHDGRMVVYYVYSADIGDGLEDAAVHPDDTPQVRELAAKMAVNIAVYVLTH